MALRFFQRITILSWARTITCAVIGFGFYAQACALTYQLPTDGSTVIGQTRMIAAVSGDTLSSLGRRYSLGIVELMEANPELSLDKTYGPNEKILLPTAYILPNAPHKGIVINLAELRLYFYVPNTREVRTFPVGIGRQGWDTPLGQTYIAAKIPDPTWIATDTIKAARLKDGVVLPSKVGPGPDNPLGPYEFRLGLPLILVHGSNDPTGIGRRSSSGCIRMQPEAIESIFKLVPINLPVIIVDEPVKVGWLGNDLYIESHIPLEDDPEDDENTLLQSTHQLLENATKERSADIDWPLVDQVTKQHLGYPIKVGVGTGPIPVIAVPLNPNAPVKANTVHARKTVSGHVHKKQKSKWYKLSHWTE